MRRDRTRSSGRHTGAIVAMLVACVPLTAILAFQTHYAVRSHREMAESVLRDYAALAAGELQRRATTEIGYRGYYRVVTVLREEAATDLATPGGALARTRDEATRAAAELAARFFRYRPAAGELLLEPDDPDLAFREALAARLASLPDAEAAGAEGFIGIHLTTLDGPTRTVVVAATTAAGPLEELVGFEVSRGALGTWFGRILARGSLLPPSLVDGDLGSEAVYVSVAPPAGPELFRWGTPFDPNLGVDVRFGDDYGGIFEGYRLSVAVDPAAAPRLVIGGLPQSRVPILLGLLAVTIGLVLAAILLLQREHAVDRLRSDFVSRVSHELRTPLTQIRMFAETLLLERTRNPEELRRSVEVIDRESRRLTHLVENLLQFSRGEQGALRVTRRRGDLARLAQEVVDELRPLAAERGDRVTVDLEAGLYALVDEDALRQVLLNLLGNALKYGPRGQEIRVELRALGPVARLAVEDEGPGVPTADRERVWERYHRLDRDRCSAVAGTGIGLTVVRELVALHRGRAWIEEAGGGGARVVVELPLAAETAGDPLSGALPGAIPEPLEALE